MVSFNNSEDAWMYRCQQLFDSALPTGAYAHSHGLEGLVQSGEVFDQATAMEFLQNEVVHSATHCDLPIFRESYSAVQRTAFGEVRKLDELANALRPTYELRRAGSQIGRQTWKLYGRILQPDSSEWGKYELCSGFLVEHQITVVTGSLAAILGIPLGHAMAASLHQTMVNFVQACIKLLNLGPTQVQEMSFNLGENVSEWIRQSDSVELDKVGSMSPRWDIASAQHQDAGQRLYIS